MRFTTARDVWEELHRLYEGATINRAYELCMELFSYKKRPEDDISSHLSRLKNLWNSLLAEFAKDGPSGKELTELLLICKILDTLPEQYFSFKSSWLLVARSDRSIDNLTHQLCAFERALNLREI